MGANAYSNCATLAVGCYLYTDTGLTTPVSNGKYSDGTYCYVVSGGSGQITAKNTCSCECHDGTITNNNSFSYYDCDGTLNTGAAEQGSTICFDINKPYSGNIQDDGISGTCSCV